MKKIILLLSLVLFSFLLKAQCPLSCGQDSLAYTATVDTIHINTGWTVLSYSVVSGPAVMVGNVATGLKPGTTSVIGLVAQSGTAEGLSVKVITVAATPIPPPVCPPVSIVSVVITGATVSGGLVVLTLSVTLSNGQVLIQSLPI